MVEMDTYREEDRKGSVRASETILSQERHSLIPIGGRIKIARQSIDLLYTLSESFLREDTPEAAFKVVQNFRDARKNPRGGFKRNFFPLDTSEVKSLLNGPGFYRGILKTDQGPAGTFASFRIVDAESDPQIRILSTSGLAIPELYFLDQLKKKGIEVSALDEIKGYFRDGDEEGARLALERLSLLCEEQGISFGREAGVGRMPFFFIRPSVLKDQVGQLSRTRLEEIQRKTTELVNVIEARAVLAKKLVEDGFSIKEAVEKARDEKNIRQVEDSSILYFQPDVILKNDGGFVVDKINIPDVVFFLSQIDSQGNSSFKPVREIAGELGEVVMDRLADEVHVSGKSRVAIVTRNEVLDSKEDTLELLEMGAISSFLDEKGISTDRVRIADIRNISSDSFTILLNIKPEGDEFNELLIKSARGEITCYPDPFILLFKDQAHTYLETHFDSDAVRRLKNIVEPIESSPLGVYRQHLALEGFLTKAGLNNGDIFYMVGDGGKTIPIFRYDLKGFSNALNYLGKDEVTMRVLNFKPEDAKVVNEDGSHLAAFRFMFIKN